MNSPQKILESRFGSVLFKNSGTVSVQTADSSSGSAVTYTKYVAPLSVGMIDQVVAIALVKGVGSGEYAKLGDIQWSSFHVRTYRTSEDVQRAGINLEGMSPSKPTIGALQGVKDLAMTAVKETECSKTYYFESDSQGRITVFCPKPVVGFGGNELPTKTTLLPWLLDYNFVYEKH